MKQEAAAEAAVAATQRAVIAELTATPLTVRSRPALLARVDAILDEQEAAILAAVEASLTETATATADYAKP